MPLENEGAPNGAAEGAAAPAESTSTPAAPAKSMEDTIREAYRASQANGAISADGEVVEGEEGAEPAQGRARGPDGKFVPKANGAAPAASAVPPPEGEAAATEQPLAAAKPHDTPPNTWKKEVTAEWAKIPEGVRQEIHRREADFHKGIGQYKDAAGFGAQMAQELLPYQQTLNERGIHPREVVKTLGNAWNTLVTGSQEQKHALLLQIAKDYGINIAAPSAEAQQPAAGATQDDPRLAAALQRIDKLEGHLSTQERQRAEAEFATHVEKVTAFGADPKHPHFALVRDDMSALIETGRATELQDAYDKAIWVNPESRKLLLVEQEKERVTKAAADAAAARKAAGANVQRRGTPPVAPKPGTMEDTIRTNYRRLTGGT